MSRTNKDVPSKFKREPWGIDRVQCENYRYRETKTTKTKKRKEVDTEDHWMNTPGWWVRMTMNKPERRGSHLLEKKVLREIDIEDVDFPDLGRKPHVYYW